MELGWRKCSRSPALLRSRSRTGVYQPVVRLFLFASATRLHEIQCAEVGLFDLRLARRIVSAIHLVADDCEACGGCPDRIGFPCKSDRRHAHGRLKMAFGTGANEPKLLRLALVLDRLTCGFPNHFERHSRRCGDRVNRRPTRLIHHRNICHFQGDRFSIRTDGEPRCRHWNHPI